MPSWCDCVQPGLLIGGWGGTGENTRAGNYRGITQWLEQIVPKLDGLVHWTSARWTLFLISMVLQCLELKSSWIHNTGFAISKFPCLQSPRKNIFFPHTILFTPVCHRLFRTLAVSLTNGLHSTTTLCICCCLFRDDKIIYSHDWQWHM